VSAPPRPRPHRRAVRQLLLGFIPLLVIEVAVLALLAVRVSAAERPLDAATTVARATVVATGRTPDGRGVAVTLDDGRRGKVVADAPADASGVRRGAELTVAYDPGDPRDATRFYVNGDAAHRRLQDLLFGLTVAALVTAVTTALTARRFLTRPRLRRAPATQATASRVVVRQGLAVRSWLELATARGVRWLPVHWAPELARLAPGSVIELRGDPAGSRLVLPVVDGAELWPSGRLRTRPPRGDRRVAEPDPEAAGTGWGRQVRGDLVPVLIAPVLGILWAYLDGAGPGGFAVATALAAGVLFWLAQLLGSDPAPPARE
jgi:hypothetical protein